MSRRFAYNLGRRIGGWLVARAESHWNDVMGASLARSFWSGVHQSRFIRKSSPDYQHIASELHASLIAAEKAGDALRAENSRLRHKLRKVRQ